MNRKPEQRSIDEVRALLRSLEATSADDDRSAALPRSPAPPVEKQTPAAGTPASTPVMPAAAEPVPAPQLPPLAELRPAASRRPEPEPPVVPPRLLVATSLGALEPAGAEPQSPALPASPPSEQQGAPVTAWIASVLVVVVLVALTLWLVLDARPGGIGAALHPAASPSEAPAARDAALRPPEEPPAGALPPPSERAAGLAARITAAVAGDDHTRSVERTAPLPAAASEPPVQVAQAPPAEPRQAPPVVARTSPTPAPGEPSAALPAPATASIPPAAVHPAPSAPALPAATASTPPAATPPVPPQATSQSPAPPMADGGRIDDAEVHRLLGEGKRHLAGGHVAAARLLFQRAAENGSGEAARLLGDTWDPAKLWALGVKGVAGDMDKAVHWYERADELGDPQAKARLSVLGR